MQKTRRRQATSTSWLGLRSRSKGGPYWAASTGTTAHGMLFGGHTPQLDKVHLFWQEASLPPIGDEKAAAAADAAVEGVEAKAAAFK